jgi:hypothetical protein
MLTLLLVQSKVRNEKKKKKSGTLQKATCLTISKTVTPSCHSHKRFKKTEPLISFYYFLADDRIYPLNQSLIGDRGDGLGEVSLGGDMASFTGLNGQSLQDDLDCKMKRGCFNKRTL